MLHPFFIPIFDLFEEFWSYKKSLSLGWNFPTLVSSKISET